MATPTPPPDEIEADTPQPVPNVQTSAHYPPGYYQLQGFSDRDNFVTDSVTMVDPAYGFWGGWFTPPVDPSTIIVPITPSAKGRTPVVTLDQIKLRLRIDPSVTVEDPDLVFLEMAARTYTERYIRQTLDPDAQDASGNVIGIGENIQQAMLLLIAQWYRNRELMVSGRLAEPPYGYAALLSSERDYPGVY